MAISSKSLAVAINERTESFLAFAIELRANQKSDSISKSIRLSVKNLS